MARLYAATGDGIVRLDETGEVWKVEPSLSGTGAQFLAASIAWTSTSWSFGFARAPMLEILSCRTA